jgi:methionine synthase I (cobalamin-dependent)
VIDAGALARPEELRAALARGLLLLDAAMGTRLIAAGLRLGPRGKGGDACLWNLTHPASVLAIHQSDAAAGAEVLLTNTFGANRRWLARVAGSATAAQVVEINRAAVALARQAAGAGPGADRFVVGDIGPSGAGGDAVEQAALLVGLGVDGLLLETHRLDQAEDTLEALDRAGVCRGRVPLLVSLLDWPEPPERALERLAGLRAEAVGVNCQDGMDAALRFAERLRPATRLPLIVMPAAGPPGRCASPRSFARAVPRLRALAPVAVGGCCGTRSAHLAAVRTAWYDTTVATRPRGAWPRDEEDPDPA